MHISTRSLHYIFKIDTYLGIQEFKRDLGITYRIRIILTCPNLVRKQKRNFLLKLSSQEAKD